MKTRFVVILFIFLQSCVLTDLKKIDNNDFKFEKVLSNKNKSYIYRANLNLYDNDFSGMIIIKPLKDNFRVVFINEIGMKFFDFEFSEQKFKVNQIFEPMNKKIFIKLLINDFRFILMNSLNSENKYFKEKESNLIAIKPCKKKELYYFNIQNNYPEKAIKYSSFRSTTFLNYSNYNNNVPNNISIKHENIKFGIELSFVR